MGTLLKIFVLFLIARLLWPALRALLAGSSPSSTGVKSQPAAGGDDYYSRLSPYEIEDAQIEEVDEE